MHHDGEDLATSALHGLIYQHIGGNVDLGRVLDEDNEWVRLDVERYISTLSKAHRKKIRHQLRAMGRDGYGVCPLYRYSSIFDHYEVNSGAPAYFHDVTYFLATQANPYNADRKGLGRRSGIINSHM